MTTSHRDSAGTRDQGSGTERSRGGALSSEYAGFEVEQRQIGLNPYPW